MTPTHARLEIPVVRRLGPYELIRRLSDGAMGERWLAQRPGPNGIALFILELLHGRALAVPEVRARVFDEARRLILLRHPNIVSVLELVELDGAWVLVMDGSEGMTLADFAGQVHQHGQRLTYALVAHIIGELLRALAHAHELRPNGLIHGAITPRDVWLSTSGAVSIGGFSLSRIAAELSRAPAAMRYMPPEQLTSGRGPCLDLFAVGGILHELLDGREFRSQASDDAQLYAAVRDGQTAALGPQHADYPVPLESLRAGLLAPQLEFRIPTARDAYALLSEWPGFRDASSELAALLPGFIPAAEPIREPSATEMIDPSALEPDAEPPPPPVSSKPSMNTIALIAGIAALALILVIVGIGAALGWWGGSEPEVAASEPAPKPEPEPALPGAELVPEADATAPVQTGPAVLHGAEPTPDAVAGSSTGGGATKTGRSGGTGRATPKPEEDKPAGLALGVSVTFVERLPGKLEVKAGGRTLEFDGRKAIILQPGTHKLEMRSPGEQTWRSAGSIEIELNKRYEVTMVDPPKALVRTL